MLARKRGETLPTKENGFTLPWRFSLSFNREAAFATRVSAAVLPITLPLYDLFSIQGIFVESVTRSLKQAVLPLTIVMRPGWLFTDFSMERAVYESGVRPFSPQGRLLTQGRVLFFCVSLLLYPIPPGGSFLHDIDLSRTIFDPWTTSAATAGVFFCLLLADAKAKRYPLLSSALLFFILNHAVEGTLISLELIFEHRDDIPSMLFSVPIAVRMVRRPDYFSCRSALQFFMAGGFRLVLAFQGRTMFEPNDIVRSDAQLWLENARKPPI